MKQLLLFLGLSVLLAGFCASSAVAQQSRIDSLNLVLKFAKDTTKANVLLDISKAYIGTEADKAISYAEKAIQQFRLHNHTKGVAYALKNKGLAYYMDGKYPEVLTYWQQSLEAFQEIDDKVGESNMLNNIGAIYFTQGWDARAIEYYLESLKVAEVINDRLRIATALMNIGAVYFNNPATHHKALEYYLKALPLSKALDDDAAMGIVSINIGEIYASRNEHEKALTYFREAIERLQKANKLDKVAYAQNNIAKVYLKQEALGQALTYHQQALATAKAFSAKLEVAQSLIGIGSILNLQGNPGFALENYLQAKAYAEELEAQHELKDAYAGLAATYQSLGKWEEAFAYQSRLLAVKDQLFNTETNQKIVNLQANYESEKKQAQIDLLTKDRELQKSALKQQALVRNALLVGLLFILAFAFVLFLNYKNKAAANHLLTLKNREINEQKEEMAAQRDHLEETYLNLVDAQAQLVQSEKMASLGQLTAGVAHEINNPINFVSAGIDSLRTNFKDIMGVAQQYFALKPDGDNCTQLRQLQRLRAEVEVEELIEESENLFKTIKNGAVRTTEIVKSLRNFTRLDESSLKNADIHEGIDSTLVILNSQLKDNNIKVMKQYGELAPFNCYPGQLNQVFMNILSNAIQAMPGEGTIHIQTSTKAGRAVISIKDTGVGMSEEVKKRIFEPFYTTKGVGDGTGLGLSITYGIIEKHQGKIEVDSKSGVGTTFILYLPLNLSENENQALVKSNLVQA